LKKKKLFHELRAFVVYMLCVVFVYTICCFEIIFQFL
jgi:hypothetical protein